jgi:uncharacterized protein (TIGR02266 family)
MTEQTERRAYPRVTFTAKVQVLNEAEARSFLAVACDISIGGMKIFTGNPAPAGQHVQVEFQLPGLQSLIRARGIVRHLMVGQGMGVEFLSLSEKDRAAIQSFVSGAK